MKQKVSRLVAPSVLLVVLMVGLLSCNMELNPGTGGLEIQLGGDSEGINWLPAIDMKIDSYTIRGTGSTQEVMKLLRVNAQEGLMFLTHNEDSDG